MFILTFIYFQVSPSTGDLPLLNLKILIKLVCLIAVCLLYLNYMVSGISIHRGFAFVEFNNVQSARRAAECENKTYIGAQMAGKRLCFILYVKDHHLLK